MRNPFIARNPAEMPTRNDLLSRSGLEFMQAVAKGELSGPPIAGVLNYTLHLVEPGRVAFRGTPRFEHTNPMGGVHGGWYGALLDSCMACAVMTMVPKGQYYTTLEYRINIARALPVGMEIEALGEVQHAGRSTGIARGEIRGLADGKLYATGSTTCLIMGSPTG
ncbi:MAG: PaaI family thioesterase [Phaeovulum sp.]|uniref:PaaI family thioesterase n=1 Tax=Phaeovulum sp. TaxID=2934796 RepID=UPI00272F34F8|nr:PaaI family thioesterase [Phaeovulum sp.]MDP2061617.1 PaaI family thioesterase [Phaeovulum sp.]